MEILSANIGTVIVLAALLLIVAGVIISMKRDKKAGKSGCGQNCAHCAMHAQCASKKLEDRR